MTKPELINQIAQNTGLTKKEVDVALAALTATITEELKDGKKVAIFGLGTFEVRKRAARTGHNPRTGETVEIAAKRIPAFKTQWASTPTERNGRPQNRSFMTKARRCVSAGLK